MRLALTTLAVLGSQLWTCPPAGGSDELFRNEVAPIFRRHCVRCHNEVERKGDFSLATGKAARESGHVESGDVAASRLVDAITPQNGSAEMPQGAPPLSERERAVIRRWIAAGAKWPDDVTLTAADRFDWWSYRPLARPAVPEMRDPWVRTPIDAFVLRAQRDRELSPAPEADRRTLIRRLSFDLLGLPPTPQQTEAFVRDRDPRAYELLVDRMLASPHYGERWARHWLDVVKYADTCGYDKDKLRPNAWPYRDYVIRSFNQDKPYGRFVQEQVAGDVLFPGEPDGILGLGFVAAGPWDFIGHVEVPESKIDGKVARNLDRDDMVSNTLNTFCSVTVQCARCHDHKFDPITQADYYGLQAIFAAVDKADRPYDLDPAVQRRRKQLESKLRRQQSDLAALEKQVADAGGQRLLDLNRKVDELRDRLKIEKPPQFGFHSGLAKTAGAAKWVEVDLGREQTLAKVLLRPCHDDFGNIGAGFGFPVRFRVAVADDSGEWFDVSDRTQRPVPNPGLTAFEIAQIPVAARRIRVTATELAPRRGVYILALAELEAIDGDGRNVALGAAVKSLDSIEAPQRWRRTNLTDGLWPSPTDREVEQALQVATRQRDALRREIEPPEIVNRRGAIQEAIKSVQTSLAKLPQGKMVYAAATHFAPRGGFKPTEGTLRPIHVLHRGDIQQQREPADAGVLRLAAAVDRKLPPDLTEGERRAELAKWLAAPDHPLVWRSIVNRVWHYHFGRGIVATPNDFGRMGAQPTHPELLDWLAAEFRDRGQSLKHLHRLIVTSSVYRQASQYRREQAGRDSGNQFLWRMRRRRLSAEEIRDSILSVSGALDRRPGGPGYYLFELEKTDHSPHYEYHKFDPADPKSHRRTVYRFIVRSQPDPWMTTLDCADSSQSTPRRNETLTSLQALSLLNNRFNLVMAERFSERVAAASEDLPDRVETAFRLVTQRAPTAAERSELIDYAAKHGLANMCRVLFNLSEFVYLD